MWASRIVQATLSLVWSVFALAAMVVANRRRYRAAWVAGAALLGRRRRQVVFRRPVAGRRRRAHRVVHGRGRAAADHRLRGARTAAQGGDMSAASRMRGAGRAEAPRRRCCRSPCDRARRDAGRFRVAAAAGDVRRQGVFSHRVARFGLRRRRARGPRRSARVQCRRRVRAFAFMPRPTPVSAGTPRRTLALFPLTVDTTRPNAGDVASTSAVTRPERRSTSVRATARRVSGRASSPT